MSRLSVPVIATLFTLTNLSVPAFADPKDVPTSEPSQSAPNSVTTDDKVRVKQLLDQLRAAETQSSMEGLYKAGGAKSIVFRQARAIAMYARLSKMTQQQLVSLGPKIAPELVTYLNDPDREVSDTCAKALGGFGIKILPIVIDCIKKGKVSAANPWASVAVFQQIGIDSVPTILDLIKGGNENQALIGLYALQTIFPENAAPTAFEKLQPESKTALLKAVHKALTNKSPKVRSLAVEVAGGVTGSDPDSVSALRSALSDKDPAVRQSALGTIGKVLKKEESLPLIRKAFSDKDLSVRQTATVVLSNIPSLDQASINQLIKGARSDSNAEFRASSLTALGVCQFTQTSLHNDAIARIAAEALAHDSSSRVKVTAIGVLGGCGNYATAVATSALRGSIKDSDSAVSDAALMAVGRLGPAAAGLLPDLIQGLDSSDSRRKLQMVRAISSMRAAAAPALPDLLKLAASPNIDPTMRLALADAFQNMGDKASQAVPVLLQMLKDKNLIVQQKAVVALGSIGPAAKDAERPLQELAAVQPRLRVTIFMSLNRINPKGASVTTSGPLNR